MCIYASDYTAVEQIRQVESISIQYLSCVWAREFKGKTRNGYGGCIEIFLTCTLNFSPPNFLQYFFITICFNRQSLFLQYYSIFIFWVICECFLNMLNNNLIVPGYYRSCNSAHLESSDFKKVDLFVIWSSDSIVKLLTFVLIL